MQAVSIDDKCEIPVIYPPYTAKFDAVEAGKHILHITLYGHRRNSFGPVHMANRKFRWFGPNAWRSEGENWCYDYMICEEGIIISPVVTEKNLYDSTLY